MDTKEKRILFVVGTLSKGGAERVATKLCNHFVDLGCDVKIACLLDSNLEYNLNKKVSIVDLSNKKRNIWSLIKWVKNLKKTIKTFKPNHIISFAGRVNIVSLLAARKNMVVVSERNDPRFDGRGRLSLLLCKLLYQRKAKAIVFQTNEVKSLFSRKINSKSLVIKNPITKPAIIKHDYQSMDNIIMVGRIVEQKNYKAALEAFKNIADKYNVSLRIFGVGELKEELLAFAIKNYIDSKVHFCGLTDNIQKEMIDASIFLLSSKYEGQSNALMEAMSLGLPCISTPVAGSNELIKNNYNGILLNGFSSIDIEEALIKLISSSNLRKTLGTNACEAMKDCYDEVAFKEWDNLLFR